MTCETYSAHAVERFDPEVTRVRKARPAHWARASRWKIATVGLVVLALLVTAIPRPIQADSPAALFAGAVALAVAGGLAADAVFDYATSDTTETETTTTDEDGDTTSSTTTTTNESTEKSTGAPTSPETPDFVRVTGTAVKNTVSGKQIVQTIGKNYDTADVLLANPNIVSVNYKVERTIKTELKRKAAFPRDGTKVSLTLNLAELVLSTRDIPKTDGSSRMTVTISANGKVLYTFKARVDQGKAPVLDDEKATEFAVKKGKDVLAIHGYKKVVEFPAEPGRGSDVIVVTVLTEGTGKRELHKPMRRIHSLSGPVARS
jgi:hypothetical protein